MIRTTFKTLCLLLVNILLLLSSCILGKVASSEEIIVYMDKEIRADIIYVLLLCNAGLSLFTFVVVQNLNDVFLHRIPSPRGVETKMKVLWILLFIVTLSYAVIQFPVLVSNWNKLLEMHFVMVTSVVVLLMQIIKLVIIHLMHPDLFGLKHRKDLSGYVGRMEAERRNRDGLYG